MFFLLRFCCQIIRETGKYKKNIHSSSSCRKKKAPRFEFLLLQDNLRPKAFHNQHMYACFHKRHKAGSDFSPWGLESRCSLVLCHRGNTLDADRHDTPCIGYHDDLCRSLPLGGSSRTDGKNARSCTKDTTLEKLAKHAAAIRPLCRNSPN